MRVEYGSVEKDGSPDLDADWLAEGWLVLLRKWLDDAAGAGVGDRRLARAPHRRDGKHLLFGH